MQMSLLSRSMDGNNKPVSSYCGAASMVSQDHCTLVYSWCRCGSPERNWRGHNSNLLPYCARHVWVLVHNSSCQGQIFEHDQCICTNHDLHQHNNNCPLTAVLSVSMTVIPNCLCFYREILGVWCHLWPHQGRSTCAKLPGFWLVSLYLPCLVGHMITLFWMTLIGQWWSYDQNKLPWQFSTELSSSGGILCVKNMIILGKNCLKNYFRDLSVLFQ